MALRDPQNFDALQQFNYNITLSSYTLLFGQHMLKV